MDATNCRWMAWFANSSWKIPTAIRTSIRATTAEGSSEPPSSAALSHSGIFGAGVLKSCEPHCEQTVAQRGFRCRERTEFGIICPAARMAEKRIAIGHFVAVVAVAHRRFTKGIAFDR